jgi:tRNA pseudouridine55 synthase
VDKPAGWTSHDVVARVRRLTGTRRVGHAGTLDPAATGVLPLGVGRGTRVLAYLSGADKVYRATIRLGIRTDTDDADGRVLAERDWRGVDEARVREALARFVGELWQTPPAYSAVKRGGVPLYRLARAGREVRPAPRRVRIDHIDVSAVVLPEVTVEVACSAGTYIRSLARDVGEVLGCGAHLAALRRLRSGPFAAAEALPLEALAEAAAAGGLPALLWPPDTALLGWPALILAPAAELQVRAGRPVRPGDGAAPDGTPARAYAADGALLGVLRARDGAWHPEKMLVGL